MPFRIALSGLNAASTELKVTGNNIANAGTTAFKKSRAEFVDVYAAASKLATGSGVRVGSISQQFTQGSVEFSDRPLDLAISGDGFFVLSDSGSNVYTRAGSFHLDSAGNVINNNNHRLQVFPLTSSSSAATPTFNTGVLQDMSLSTSAGPPAATATIFAGLNLDARDANLAAGAFNPTLPATYHSSTSVVIFDSLGSPHPTTMYYLKTANNTVESRLYVDGNLIAPGGGTSSQMDFSTSGIITSGNVQYLNIPAAGAANMNITINYSNTTQYGSQFAVNSLSQDGYASGRLSGIDVDGEGVVFARFTNGQSTALGKVALANFSNGQGLQQLGDTSWAESFESGVAVLGEPGSGSLGQIQSGALETSNVDIATSLVALITAQRNFQANAQVISTADTITQTVINI